MAKNWSLVVYGDTDSQPFNSRDKTGNLHRVINYLRSCLAGARLRPVTMIQSNDAVAATGTLTISSGSGSVGGIINGVTVTATWATSDANSAALVAAAINASGNALVNQHVTASAASNVVTLTSKDPGNGGNAVTLAASGTGVTASGARLTGGTVASTSNTFIYG